MENLKKLPSEFHKYRSIVYEFEHLIKGENKGKFRTIVFTGFGCSYTVSANTKSHKKAKEFIDARWGTIKC